MKILVTGAAGFIGNEVCRILLLQGEEIIGIDNINSYYDISLKEKRLERLQNFSNFVFYRTNIADYEALTLLFKKHKLIESFIWQLRPEFVIHWKSLFLIKRVI